MTGQPADGFLHLLKANPSLLPAAPDPYTAAQMGSRVADEVHSCLRCGDRAQCALVADTTAGPRWLDLCQPCLYWLQKSEDGHMWDAP